SPRSGDRGRVDAHSPSTPTRRGLLAGAAVLPAAGAVAALAGPAVATPDPDAELIRLVDEAEQLNRESNRLWLITDHLPNAEAWALRERVWAMTAVWHEQMRAISEMPARTEAGLKAKARVVADFLEDGHGSINMLAASLARDVLAGR